MNYGCYEYAAGRDCKEPNLICTSLEMAMRIIELLVDSLIGMNNRCLLGIILISNNHGNFINGLHLLQPPTLEYIKLLNNLRKFIDDTLPGYQSTRLPHGIIINALLFLMGSFTKNLIPIQVILLTNHWSDKKFYGSKQGNLIARISHYSIVVHTLVLSENRSIVLSELSNKSKGKYIDHVKIKDASLSQKRISSHYLLEHYSLIENTLNKLEVFNNFDTYTRILSHFRKKLTTTEDTLTIAVNNKKEFIQLFQSGTTPNIIHILRLISNYSRTPNPYCKIYSILDNILDWMCILQGPDNSPYKDSLLFLEFHFGTEYPRRPPTFRFLSSHYHPNIRVTGEVCHPILIEDYHSDISLRQMLDSIYDMLCSPVFSHAVRYKVFEVFLFHKQIYSQLVESFGNICLFKKSLNDCLSDFCIKNSLKSSHPEPFICPLTKELFDSPVMTRGGDTYERCAILQYVKQYQCDPFTKLPLTESELFPNKALSNAVSLYREEIHENVYWWEQ